MNCTSAAEDDAINDGLVKVEETSMLTVVVGSTPGTDSDGVGDINTDKGVADSVPLTLTAPLLLAGRKEDDTPTLSTGVLVDCRTTEVVRERPTLILTVLIPTKALLPP